MICHDTSSNTYYRSNTVTLQTGPNMATINQTSLAETGKIFSESCSVILQTTIPHAPDTSVNQGEQSCDLQTIYNMLVNVNSKVNNIHERLEVVEKFEARLSGIENVVQIIPKDLSVITNGMEKMEIDIAGLNNTMAEFKSDLQGLSDIFDNVKKEVTKTSNKCTAMSYRLSALEADLQAQTNLRDIERSEVLDLKCRNMQKNLLFCGIKEEQGENCEDILKDFIYNKMEITKDIQFDRVHRLLSRNIPTRQTVYRRPPKIIAAFTNYKERELVRSAALSGKLKDTGFSVFEQFPMEIEEKRKTLYPILKEAKKAGRKVRLVRDKLYIDNKEYKPCAGLTGPPSAGVPGAMGDQQDITTPASKRHRQSSTPPGPY